MFLFYIMKMLKIKYNNPSLIKLEWNAQFGQIVIIGVYNRKC